MKFKIGLIVFPKDSGAKQIKSNWYIILEIDQEEKFTLICLKNFRAFKNQRLVARHWKTS